MHHIHTRYPLLTVKSSQLSSCQCYRIVNTVTAIIYRLRFPRYSHRSITRCSCVVCAIVNKRDVVIDDEDEGQGCSEIHVCILQTNSKAHNTRTRIYRLSFHVFYGSFFSLTSKNCSKLFHWPIFFSFLLLLHFSVSRRSSLIFCFLVFFSFDSFHLYLFFRFFFSYFSDHMEHAQYLYLMHAVRRLVHSFISIWIGSHEWRWTEQHLTTDRGQDFSIMNVKSRHIAIVNYVTCV